MGGGFFKSMNLAVLGVCFFDASRKSKKTSSFPKTTKKQNFRPHVSMLAELGSVVKKKWPRANKTELSDPTSASKDT